MNKEEAVVSALRVARMGGDLKNCGKRRNKRKGWKGENSGKRKWVGRRRGRKV